MTRPAGQGPNPFLGSPLLGRYDQDPGRFLPRYYPLELSVPVGLGGVATGSIHLANEPYCLTRITHKIVGDVNDPETTGLWQDGMYDIEWNDEQRAYTQAPGVAADLMFGWNSTGYVLELPIPIAYPGNNTLTFRIVNRLARVLVPTADHFQVQIALHGIVDRGEPQ